MKFEDMLDRYAELVVKVGIHVQKMQTLVVSAPVHAAGFVRTVVKKAYEAGAKHVYIDWTDDQITRLKYELAPEEAFEEYPLWRAKGWEEMAENGAAFLYLSSSNPDLLQGISPERMAKASKAASKAMETFRSYTRSDKVSWSIIAVPSPEWANTVFPDLPEDERVMALWNAIFSATRVDSPDPVQAWNDHQKELNHRIEYLNQKQYKALFYDAPGTNLSVALPDNHVWIGGGSVNQSGVSFMANMPTEEVFTAPKKDGVNGVVQSTKPLSYQGNLIEDFQLTFENGKIVQAVAKKGEATLKQLIATDEGSHFLGELALVPDQSPISQSNIIFFNTLFDENASNHLAIGNAYPTNLRDGITMSKEELEKHGLNTSMVHVDFMIGSNEMNIDGELADGTREPIFRKGNWAF
ncbi:aminopeptidase [Brevibacillus invocatus]|uniref:Aminopeptidase n=1 Tax=Brevibacillus invocatus TaxID=173959 RepID=A0A3M8CHI2_9BACL|nr:aminopeptidase [Brevibacillus invocatus]RNB75214.1 aminopeptidase [Brevibacillus invocatus]